MVAGGAASGSPSGAGREGSGAAVVGDQHGKGDGEEGKEIGGVIRGEEMRLLDLHDGHGGESRGQQAHLAPIQPGGDQIEQEDHAQVGHGRDLPAHDIDLVIARLFQPLRQIAHDQQRQVAIHIKAIAAVVRVQGGSGSVEIIPQRLHRLEGGLYHGQEPLVGVQVLNLVPVQPHQAEPRRAQQHDDQKQVIDPGAFLASQSHLSRVISRQKRS